LSALTQWELVGFGFVFHEIGDSDAALGMVFTSLDNTSQVSLLKRRDFFLLVVDIDERTFLFFAVFIVVGCYGA
jgi:hypothetical protein